MDDEDEMSGDGYDGETTPTDPPEDNAERCRKCGSELCTEDHDLCSECKKMQDDIEKAARLGYELSTYAASINWTPCDEENELDNGNTREWLIALKEKIEQVQETMVPHLSKMKIPPGFNMESPKIPEKKT